MFKRRQVRFSYPSAFIRLVVMTAIRDGKISAAKTFGVPTSSVYRWFADCQAQPALFSSLQACDEVSDLIAVCEAHGFDVRAAASAVEAIARAPEQVRITPPDQSHQRAVLRDTIKPARKSVSSAESSAVYANEVALAHAHIQTRYYAKISCERLGAMVGMTRYNFIRKFKAELGVSPYRCLTEVRVAHARQLLCSTSQPLDVIAAAVGFDSPTSLCRSFKRVEGVSLSAFFRGTRLGHSPAVRYASAEKVAAAASE